MACGIHENPVTDHIEAVDYFQFCANEYGLNMSATLENVIEFPLHRRREMKACPHCGKRDNVWQIGRLLWAYCETHEIRWVVADYKGVSRATINRRELRKGLEFLSVFVEIS